MTRWTDRRFRILAERAGLGAWHFVREVYRASTDAFQQLLAWFRFDVGSAIFLH
jgi:hypothetical protein